MCGNKQAIEIKHLTKYYGKHRGVSRISLEVPEGDIFGFLGPNGAGKSTTIRCMLGMLHFQEGEIRLLQMDTKKQMRDILCQVGYMPSETMFYPGMKVKDVIRFAARARNMNCDKEAERICRLLEVDREKKIGELSLGNRKKVGIVCAMQHKPRLLILDEPTSGLDPLMQEAFFQLILEYNAQGTTCFLSSHVLSEIKRYCRNAAIIKDGELVKVDSVENLLKSGIRQIRIWKDGKEQRLSYDGDMRKLIKKLDEMQVDDLLIEEPSLEELFIHYYEAEGKNRERMNYFETEKKVAGSLNQSETGGKDNDII